jgi:acyl transferase domain-containing protein
LKDSLAIVGMACRLPGADGLDAFWRLVAEGRTAWGPLPESRFSRELYFHPEKSRVGKSYSEMGAVVSDRPADPAVCPITPEMFRDYDVAHHIFLEVASLACRDAGMDPFAMPGDRRTGVYVGHTGGSTKIGDIVYATGIDETAALLSEVDAARAILGEDVDAVSAEVTAAVRKRYPGRKPGDTLDLGAIGAAKIVQEALKLDGPYLVVDAACASSLQAMAIGARSLLQGGIDQAIVGGASYCKSDSLVLFSAAQSVSNAGSCPFGEAADGLITAEGYVALVIKTLSRAIADGDRIRAVIRGLGVASDGKGKSLWAPRQEGQVLAVERAYPDSTDIGRIEYIEAHATSTQVGDATELGALSGLMAKHLPAGRQIPIGSVKANIGHTLETAGIASLVKVVLAMEHGQIPPGSTCDELNSEFDWKNGPFLVPKAPLPWPAHADGSPRCAAVNAFGIGGLNVHVSLAEHASAKRPETRSSVTLPIDDDANAIAIVGSGCVLPGALTLDSFFDLLGRGETAIGPVPAGRWKAERVLDPSGPRPWHTMSNIGGFVRDFNYDWRRHKVPPKQIAAANPLQFMLLEAADAAIADAGGAQAGLDRTRTGVVVGTLFGGDFANQLQQGLRLPETGVYLRASLARHGVAPADIDRIVASYEKKLLERLPALVDETGSFTSSTLASRLTKTFDLMGGALALDSGDCSSLSAISAAVDMLRERACDAVLCAAGERCMDLMAYEGRSLGGFLATRPTSVLNGQPQGGDVPGEGAVVLVLKRLADARAAGNRIRGVIRGVAVGSGRTGPEATRRVVREACEKAAIDPAAVKAFEVAVAGGHKKSGDELAILGGHYVKQPAASEQSVSRSTVAGSLDGQIGHAGAAAGAAALLKLTHALATGIMPGSVALNDVRSNVQGLAASASACPLGAVDAAGYRAGCVTVIQERQAGHLVLDNGLPVPQAARPQHAQSASTVEAIRAPQPARSVAHAGGKPLVAAIFPGQGSQYTDMFRGLVEDSTEARSVLTRLDRLARAQGRETLAEIAWHPANGLGTKIWDTQWAMYLGDLLAWGVLQGMGFVPDVVASHSFGEFPALAAVGAWSIGDGARATIARADAVERHGPRNGAMLSVIADRATVMAAIEPFGGQVWVCAENAPEQFVVGGTARIVDAVEVILDSRRVKSKRLAVPSPFHTPLLASAAESLAATIRSLPIATPQITTFSSTTTSALGGPADIQESLIRQMTETVRWVGVVERLYESGARTFVEVGPSGVLTGLTRRILEGREGVTFLQFDQRGRSLQEHLARLREQLAAAGALGSGESGQSVEVPSKPRQPEPPGRIVSFDATARRRERNRSGGAAHRGSARPVGAATHEEVGHNGNEHSNGHSSGHEHRKPPTLQPTAAATQLLELEATPTHRLTAIAKEQTAAGADAGCLEDAVAELLAEAGVEPPLMRAGAASRGVQAFLDSATHLFEITVGDHAAILSAASRDAIADVLARSGGKARWLSRRSTEEGPAAAEIENFLIDFVVEQTGYPREIVELDADLEADLGIDSIRKAQLFGEIGQKYGLTADDSVSLDDFSTLRHLLGYMLPRVGGKSAPPAVAPAQPSAIQANGQAQNGHAQPAAPAAPVAADDGLATELETFLIDFVVEQTGYPREIVELDADLEADLGIDSIRKAQLFGEIGQKYGLTADDSVSLDEFPTLRHLIGYMLPRVGGKSVSPAATAAKSSAVPASGHGANGHASNGHAPRTAAGAATPVSPVSADDGLATELETFLIDFVVEQTGYPREIVELDADLEADLGIDSIRKAQLFGEIGQKYGLTADDSVSLDEFPTLRHLLGYMLPRVSAKSASGPAVLTGSNGTRSEDFERGLRNGREHAAAIRLWARQIAAVGVSTGPVVIDPAIDKELAGIAEGAGIEVDIVRAAYADPAAALGGCDAVIVAPTDAGAIARGLLVCFGRNADPAAKRFEAQGLSGTLVSVKGLPGAIVGWNDAGLVATISNENVRNASVAGTVERVVTECRSMAEADAMIARMATRPCGLIVANVRGGGIEVSAAGKIVAIRAVFQRCDPRAALARAALADGTVVPEQALSSLLLASAGSGESLSATCAWMAVGSAAGKPAVRAGGPAGRDWLAAVATDPVGEAWLTVSRDASLAARKSDGRVEQVTRRYRLALRDAGWPRSARSLSGERVLILGSGSLADALAGALTARGARPSVLDCSSAEEAIAAVERAETGGPVRHLVVATPRQQTAVDWLSRRSAAVVAPFFACQRWLVLRGNANDIGSATLTTVAQLGGDFGLSGTIGSVVSGAMAGLFKGIAREFSSLHVRVVDAAAGLAETALAAGIVAEMQDGVGPVEVGLVDGRRVTIAACETGPAASTALESLRQGSTWVVTGGARGVTAECARELGRKFGLKLALVGSTAPVAVEQAWLSLDEAGLRDLKGRMMLDAKARGCDPRTAWKMVEKSIEIGKSLAKFKAAGVDAKYFACNLSDAAAVRTLVHAIARDVGPVRGIVHGAGFEAACRFEKKTVDGLEATLGPKCAGLEHLVAAVDPATLEAIVGFGSTSGRLGGHGQADYSLANDMLAKMLGQLRQRRGLRATVFHWHAWDEVGMASRPESRFVLEQFGLKFMPLAEGVRRFMDEIEAGLPDTEVLVTEPAMCPDAVSSADVDRDTAPATTVSKSTAAAVAAGYVPQRRGDVGSLVGGVEQQGGSTWVSFQLDPGSDRFLIDHLQYGRPLLPAVMGAELLAQAAVAAGACGHVQEIRDFTVERPIGFPVDAPRDVRVEIGERDGDTIVAQGWAAVLNAEGRTAGEERVHFRGKVFAGPVEPVAATLDESPFPFNPMVYQEDAPLRHGPSFRTLDGLFLDRSGGWGRLVSQHGDGVTLPRGPTGWTVPVALLDGCIVACAVYSYILCGRRVEVPVAFERLRIMSPPRGGEKCVARLLFRSQDSRESIYDLVLFGDDGRAVLALDGLHLAVMAAERSRSS